MKVLIMSKCAYEAQTFTKGQIVKVQGYVGDALIAANKAISKEKIITAKEVKKEEVEVTEEAVVEKKEPTYPELQELAKAKGIRAVGRKKADLIKELGL